MYPEIVQNLLVTYLIITVTIAYFYSRLRGQNPQGTVNQNNVNYNNSERQLSVSSVSAPVQRLPEMITTTININEIGEYLRKSGKQFEIVFKQKYLPYTLDLQSIDLGLTKIGIQFNLLSTTVQQFSVNWQDIDLKVIGTKRLRVDVNVQNLELLNTCYVYLFGIESPDELITLKMKNANLTVIVGTKVDIQSPWGISAEIQDLALKYDDMDVTVYNSVHLSNILKITDLFKEFITTKCMQFLKEPINDYITRNVFKKDAAFSFQTGPLKQKVQIAFPGGVECNQLAQTIKFGCAVNNFVFLNDSLQNFFLRVQ